MSKHTPRYLYIKNMIIEFIQKGNLLSNGRLPSEDELAKICNVSRTTVRSALQSLENEGVIVKRHGSGNFVSHQTNYLDKNATFAMVQVDVSALPIIEECRVRQIQLSEDVAQKLNEKPGTEALEIFKRLTEKGEESGCMVERVPLHYIKVMPKPEEIPQSIYVFVARFCGLEIDKIVSDIVTVPASESPFVSLEGSVLKLEEVFQDVKGQPIIYSEYYINQAKMKLHVIRNKPPEYWRPV